MPNYYIVIFNPNSRDSCIMTDSKGFVETFTTRQVALEEAEKWLDGEQYRAISVLQETDNES